MVVRRRSSGSAKKRVTATAVRRVPAGSSEAAVAQIQTAASIFKAKVRVDQNEAVAGRKMGLPFTIGPVSSVGIKPLNGMFYGDTGFGKTTLAASAADVASMRDVLFINIDEGIMSLTSRRTMDFVRMTHYDQIARIFEYISLHCYYRDQKPMNVAKLLEYELELKSEVIDLRDQVTVDFHGNVVGTDPDRTWFVEQRLRSGKPMDEPYIYHTVIIDTISELHRLLIYKFTGIDLNKVKLDEEVEEMEEWRAAQELFIIMVRAFKTLAIHTIFVSAMAQEPSERNKRKNPKAGQMLPKMAGKMPIEVASHVDIVGFLDLIRPQEGGEVRRLYLGAGYENWISKHRFENLPGLEYIDNPTMQSLIDLARKDAEADGSTDTTRIGPGTGTAAASNGSSNANATSSGSGSRGTGRGQGIRRRHS